MKFFAFYHLSTVYYQRGAVENYYLLAKIEISPPTHKPVRVRILIAQKLSATNGGESRKNECDLLRKRINVKNLPISSRLPLLL